MESIIVLAAGLSSRMKLNKQKALFKINNKSSIVDTCLNALEYSNNVIVVTGYQHLLVEQELKDINVTTIYNNEYEKGQFSSLKKALTLIKDENFFVTTCDLINIKKDLYENLSNNLNFYDYIRPVFKGKIGHPVLHKNFLKNILLTSNKNSAKQTLKDYKEKLLCVEQSSCIDDFDTVEQYLSLTRNSNLI